MVAVIVGEKALHALSICEDCGVEIAAYIGETGRNAYSRGCEHLDNLNSKDEEKSVASQQVSSSGEGGRGVHHDGDGRLQGAPRQAAHGESADLQLQGASPYEQEERDGWLEGGEDAVQEVGRRLEQQEGGTPALAVFW